MTEGILEADVCTLTVECWSKECASFIRYNQEERIWQYKNTWEGTAGTYLYAIIYDCPSEYRRQIETFEFKVKAKKKTVKWTLPALDSNTLYKFYKKYMPKRFKMVKPYERTEAENEIYFRGSKSRNGGAGAVGRKK
jgi:hypothetical protein